jgi:hypothetical protein
MTKQLFNGLLVLAALLIPSLSFANSVPITPTPSQPTDTVSIPVIQPLPVDDKLPALWLTGRVSLVGGEVSSSKQQFGYAMENQLPFMTNEADYETRIASGYFVRLEGPFLEVHAKRPYALPSTVAFATEMSVAYNTFGCGRLVIKDTLRLTTERPKNGSPESVHPAGMALDIRTKYIPVECADWLRTYISQKEAEGKVDGTQEWKPEHLHIVVPLQPRGPSLLQPTIVSTGAL